LGSTPGDITFVVDRSGSMEGNSIEEVRNAPQLCLRSMIPGCRFNIVGFGSRFESLFDGSRSYDEASLAEASKHVAALTADLGGTEILPALKFVLERREDRSLPRHIVVLTDGEVTNTDAVLSLAKSHAAHARIFTFGIGAGASHHLVNGLARRRRHRRVHLSRGTHRAEGRAPVRTAALARVDERSSRLGRLQCHGGHVGAAAGLLGRPAARIRAGERRHRLGCPAVG
jgi:Mg-chelatase subunit ChlD